MSNALTPTHKSDKISNTHCLIQMPDFVDPGSYGDVSGEMASTGATGTSSAEEYNTLDEPVMDTIVSEKIQYVNLINFRNSMSLRNCFWSFH